MNQSNRKSQNLNLLLVGGTGRSGTSFVYRQILQNAEIEGYSEFESQLFTSNLSLVDVYDRYTNSYSPERFDFVCNAFRNQVKSRFISLTAKQRFSGIFKKHKIDTALDQFISGLKTDRLASQAVLESFRYRTMNLLQILFEFQISEKPGSWLLEKTPHNILFFSQINQIIPGSKIIHVIRDPRAIAESLVRQNWGPNEYPEAVLWVKKILDTWILQYKQSVFSRDNLLCIRAEDLTVNQTSWENKIRSFTNLDLVSLDLTANSAALDGWRENLSDQDFNNATRDLKPILDFFSYNPEITNCHDQAVSGQLQLP